MIIWLNEILEKCNKGTETKQILLNVNGKIIPMGQEYYITDGIWYSLIPTDEKGYVDNDSFIDIVEQECITYPDTWGDLYTSPMDDIGNCELRFADENTRFENNIEDKYEIKNITDDEKNIIIYLVDKE